MNVHRDLTTTIPEAKIHRAPMVEKMTERTQRDGEETVGTDPDQEIATTGGENGVDRWTETGKHETEGGIIAATGRITLVGRGIGAPAGTGEDRGPVCTDEHRLLTGSMLMTNP